MRINREYRAVVTTSIVLSRQILTPLYLSPQVYPLIGKCHRKETLFRPKSYVQSMFSTK